MTKLFFNNVLPVLGIILFVFFAFKFGHKYYHLNHYGSPIYARIDTIYLDWRNDKKIEFSFEVKGVKYDGGAWYNEKLQPKIGELFLVKYSTRDPSINEMIFE